MLLDADRNMPSMLKANEQMLTHLGKKKKDKKNKEVKVFSLIKQISKVTITLQTRKKNLQ